MVNSSQASLIYQAVIIQKIFEKEKGGPIIVELIKKGGDIDWRSDELNCKSCGSVFRIKTEDVFLYDEDAYYTHPCNTNDKGHSARCRCPSCKTSQKIFVPDHVYSDAYHRHDEIMIKQQREIYRAEEEQRKKSERTTFRFIFGMLSFFLLLIIATIALVVITIKDLLNI